MSEIKKTKRKRRKKISPLMRLGCVCLILFSCVLLYKSGKEFYTTIQLKKNLSQVEKKLAEVKEENSALTDQKAKLQDPDYVESYARENYNLSKKGEQIFYLPESNKK